MAANKVGIGAMFGWIASTFGLLRKDFTGMLLASVINLLVMVLLFVPMWLVAMPEMISAMQTAGAASAGAPIPAWTDSFYRVYLLTMVLAMVALPPLLLGWFRMARDIDRGLPVRGTDILKPYRDGALWLRSLGFMLLAMLAYLAVLALFVAAFWGAISGFMQQVAAQQAAAFTGAAPVPPHFSGSLVLAYFVILAIMVLLQFVYMVGLSELALRPTGAVAALTRAARAVGRNALKLMVFLLGAGLLMLIVVLILGVVIGLLVAAGSLAGGKVAVVLACVLYLPILLFMYPLLFAGHYFMWKSLLGDDGLDVPTIDANPSLLTA